MYPSPEPGSLEPEASPYAPIRGGWLALAVASPALLSLLLIGLAAQPLPVGTASFREASVLHERLDTDQAMGVVVLGNSVAQRALHPQRLRALLGVPDAVVSASLPSATPITWFAILRHWIYGMGHEPELVLVVAPSHAFWVGQSQPGLDLRGSLQIAGTTDATIEAHRRALWMRSDALRHLSMRRQVWRLYVRTVALRAAGGAGVATIDDSLETFVMGVEQTRPLAAPEGLQAEDLVTTLDETMLGELVDAVHGRGGTVLFAIVPLREEPDDNGPVRDAALAAWARDHGAALLDLPQLGLSAEHYVDNQHLTPRGSAIYTEALAAATRRQLDPRTRRRQR